MYRKFLWFEKRFQKAAFSWRISVDGREAGLTREIELRFQIPPA